MASPIFYVARVAPEKAANTVGAGLPPWSPWTHRPQAIECASNDTHDSIEYPQKQGGKRACYFAGGEAYALPAETIGADIDKEFEIGI